MARSQRGNVDRPDERHRWDGSSVVTAGPGRSSPTFISAWRQARRSLGIASLVAAGFFLCFAALILHMPKLKVHRLLCLKETCLTRLHQRNLLGYAGCKHECSKVGSSQNAARHTSIARCHEAVCHKFSSRSANIYYILIVEMLLSLSKTHDLTLL